MINTSIKYIEILKKHRGLAVFSFLLVLICTFGFTKLQDTVYQTSAEIYIVPKPLTVTGNAYVFTDYDYRMLNNQIEILKSDKVAVLAHQYLEKNHPEIIQRYNLSDVGLQNSVHVDKKADASVLAVNFVSKADGDHRQDLRTMLAGYITAYKDYLKESNSRKASDEVGFLEEQLADAEKNLEEESISLQTFHSNNQSYNIDAEINQMIMSKSRLNEQAKTLAAEIQARQEKVVMAKKQLPAEAEYINFLARIERDAEASQLRKNIVTLEAEKAEWSSKITDAHPKMKAYNAELDRLNDLLGSRLNTFGRQYKDDLGPINAKDLATSSNFDLALATDVIKDQIDLETLKAKYSAFRNAINQIGDDLSDVPEKKLAYAERKVRFEMAQDKVKLLQKRLDEAKILEAVSADFTSIEILKEPEVPGMPLRPNLPKNMTAALLLGLCFSLFAVFVRASMDKSLAWPFQLNGIVAKEEEEGIAGSQVFELPKLPSRRAFGQMMESTNFTVPEAYKRVIIHLENQAKLAGARKVGIVPVSNVPDGNITSALLGLYMTELSNKMVLIDTDHSKHSVTNLVASLGLPISTGIEQGPGLSDYLEDQVDDFVDVIYPLGKTVYGSFIPVGSPMHQTGFQFSNKNLAQLDEHLSPNYNFVLFTTTSIQKSFDAVAVGRTLDGVFLLVHPNMTTLDQVNAAYNELKSVGCNILGILYQPVK